MRRGDQQSDFPPEETPPGGNRAPRPEPQNNGAPDDDSVLLEAALRGDIDAFAELFESYRPSLFSLCLKRLGDPSLAEDIVQEVFIKAFTNLSTFDRRKPIWPWLATIAARMSIGLQRRRSYTHYSEDIGTAIDADVNRQAMDHRIDATLDAVIASEERAKLSKSLHALSKRQRRVFLLNVVDGWSCAEIADAEGISVGAVYLLLFRARRKMRSLRENGPLPAIVLPFSWLRWKFQRAEERIRPLLGAHAEGLSSACVQLVCLGALAIVVGATSSPAEPFAANKAVSSDETVVATQSPSLRTGSLQTASPNIGASVNPPVESQQPAADSASSLIEDVINPNQNATPETTTFYSITASPNYESDHTVLAVGHSSSTYVLFVSRDGGGSWQPRSSRLLGGSTLVLPPDFPRDGRIFTFGGMLGLQQSDDGGEIFRTVSPILGQSVAISPSFGKGDSKILMGGDNVFEFDNDTGLALPASLTIPQGGDYRYVAYSPGYLSEFHFFVSSGHNLYRCKGSVCNMTPLPTAGPLRVRFSPLDQDSLAYAFTPYKLLVSHDGAQTFGEVQFPLMVQSPLMYEGYIRDVAIAWNTSSNPAIFVSVYEFSSLSRYPPGVYRSLDSGRSWSRTSIDIPGFGDAANKLMMTPTGRLLATAAYGRGIACSVDGGQTWRPRCPPEP